MGANYLFLLAPSLLGKLMPKIQLVHYSLTTWTPRVDAMDGAHIRSSAKTAHFLQSIGPTGPRGYSTVCGLRSASACPGTPVFRGGSSFGHSGNILLHSAPHESGCSNH